jgi:hypothetical protein
MDEPSKESISPRFSAVRRTDKWNVLQPQLYALLPRAEEHLCNHMEHITRHFELCGEWAPLRNFFFERLCAAEFHWFFIQGIDAIMNGLYIPGVSSILNGIEASLRMTLAQVTAGEKPVIELSPYRVLSNNLIFNARDMGMPIAVLAFPNEADFDRKLESQKPNRVDVEIVRYRNNICHGNILEFVNRDLGKENSFFTPISLRSLAFILIDISGAWAEQLGQFRRSHNLLDYDH